MTKSLKLSYLFVRLGLAAVFLWFGIDKFFNPSYWINAWTPIWLIEFIGRFGIDKITLIYLFGIFEILVGISLLSTVFIRIFSFLAIIFLISIFIFVGLNEVVIRDLGLIGGFLALLFWPSKNNFLYPHTHA